MSAAASRNAWAAGMQATHDEAAGVLSVQVVLPAEILALVLDAMVTAAAESCRLFIVVADIADRINAASRTKKPMLCSGCDTHLPGPRFAVVVASGYRDDATRAIALCVCSGCGTERPAILRVATVSLRRIWPDVREIELSPGSGRA